MKFEKTNIQNYYIIRPEVLSDNRGIFRRHFCKKFFFDIGVNFNVKQGNISENFKVGTLRGFHYNEIPSKEDKLLSCITGSAWNITIDIRKKSPTYLKKIALELSSENKYSIYIPAGCANAFLTLKDNTVFHYYMGDYFESKKDKGFRFDDPSFNISWPIEPKIISEKDLGLPYYKA